MPRTAGRPSGGEETEKQKATKTERSVAKKQKVLYNKVTRKAKMVEALIGLSIAGWLLKKLMNTQNR